MASFRKRGKVWYYRIVDADGAKVERKGCSDRRATEEMARAAEAEAARGRAGLIDPKVEARRQHGARPLAAHLADWHAHLIAKGGTPKHADLSLDRARRVVALARGGRLADIDPPKTATKAARGQATAFADKLLGPTRLDDLTPTAVQSALAALRDGGRSLQTCNHHRTAIRGFARWAWRDGRTSEYALIAVAGFNANGDRRHDRRTLGLDELRRLVEAAHRGGPYRGMTGPDRAMAYRLAAATGLRYSEIASLAPHSFDLDGAAPAVTVAAAYTKNGDPASLNLPPDLAADLRDWLAYKPADVPAFPLPEKGAAMLRVDLAASGIPYRDAGGLFFDFHALRCQHATLLDLAGITPRVVQKRMRHSTLELTGRYTRPRAVDLERAADSMPSLRPAGQEPAAEPLARTGTGPTAESINIPFAHYLPTAGGGSGRELSDGGEMRDSVPAASISPKSLTETGVDGGGRGLTVPDASSGVRIRTGDLRFMSPLL